MGKRGKIRRKRRRGRRKDGVKARGRAEDIRETSTRRERRKVVMVRGRRGEGGREGVRDQM